MLKNVLGMKIRRRDSSFVGRASARKRKETADFCGPKERAFFFFSCSRPFIIFPLAHGRRSFRSSHVVYAHYMNIRSAAVCARARGQCCTRYCICRWPSEWSRLSRRRPKVSTYLNSSYVPFAILRLLTMFTPSKHLGNGGSTFRIWR